MTSQKPVFDSLSFDGCGINGRDAYRSRLCTFTEKRGETARHYGPLFAAAPELLNALERLLHPMASEDDIENAREVVKRAKAQD